MSFFTDMQYLHGEDIPLGVKVYNLKNYCDYREISIAFNSKRGLCAVGRRMLTRGHTELDMCPDSSVYEYIPRMHRSQSDHDRRVIWC